MDLVFGTEPQGSAATGANQRALLLVLTHAGRNLLLVWPDAAVDHASAKYVNNVVKRDHRVLNCSDSPSSISVDSVVIPKRCGRS